MLKIGNDHHNSACVRFRVVVEELKLRYCSEWVVVVSEPKKQISGAISRNGYLCGLMKRN